MSPSPSVYASGFPDEKAIHVLHVDDDPSFAELVATYLERERERLTVHTETDPRDALDAIRDDDVTFDCVVSDYEMPGLDGLELLRRVREDAPELPFVLFTGKGSEEIASEAITAGVTEYLQKDSTTEQYQVLANRVENAAEHYRAQQYLDRGLEAIETATEGIAILSGDGRFEYLNSTYADLLGYDREDLLGSHWERIYRDEDVDDIYDVVLPAAREGRWNGDTELVRKDGTVTTLDHTVSYAEDQSLVCTLSMPDADESVRTALSMRERAMNEAPIGIVITDPHMEDNPVVYANEEFSDLTGYAREEVVGRNCRFLQGDETRAEPVARLREAVENEETVTVELRNYRKDGTEFWNRIRVAPLVNDDGEVDYFVGFQDDVTAKKAHEERLQSQTARLEALFEHSPDMIAVHDADGVLQAVNHRLCDELGYEEEELLGKTVWDIDVSADPDQARPFWRDLPTNTPRRFEGELERANGETVPVEVHLIRLDLDGEDRFVAMDRDITAQKERESELVAQNQRLDRFAGIVSHDLRNPLNVAEGHVELLKDECDSDHLDAVENAHDRMDALIEDLLVLSKAGTEAMDIEPVSLPEVARECWGTVATDGATLDVRTERTVSADREQLKQLFENLVRNSIEHGDENVTVTVGDLPDGTGFYVADDGPGIPEEERERVFDRGYTTENGGTGLGLSIVSDVAGAHGWSVSVTEGPDGGTCFEISTADE